MISGQKNSNMKAMKKPKKQFAVVVENELSSAIEKYLKDNKLAFSAFVKMLIIPLLMSKKYLDETYRDTTKNGGDRWTSKLTSEDPKIRLSARAKLKKQAAKARAAKISKNSVHIVGNNSGVIIAGDNAIIDK